MSAEAAAAARPQPSKGSFVSCFGDNYAVDEASSSDDGDRPVQPTSSALPARRRRRESVDPLRRAAVAAQRTTRVLLRQFGLELRPGSLAALRAFCGRVGLAPRVVSLNPLQTLEFLPTGQLPAEYPDNYVTSAKYTVFTFLPLFLFELFSRVAYLYFLLQAALTWWSEVSPFNPYGGTAALLFIVIVAGIRAGAEDLTRHRADMHTNNSVTHLVCKDGVVRDVRWSAVRVGQLLCVRDGEALPADLLFLASGLDEGVAFVRTVNLDGETNLKTKHPALNLRHQRHLHQQPPTSDGATGPQVDRVQGDRAQGRVAAGVPSKATTEQTLADDHDDVDINEEEQEEEEEEEAIKNTQQQRLEAALKQISGLSGLLTCEPPSRNMHRFHGSLQLTSQAGQPLPRPIPITMNELLLRGSLLRNTGWVLGLVVYCGPDTRIQMNAASRAPFKSGSLDKMLNVQIVVLIIIQLLVSLATGLASWLWREHVGVLRPHLALNIASGANWGPARVYIPLASLTAWILYSYLVPISLLVTMEIVKLIQGVVYISRDKRLQGYAGGGGAGSGMPLELSSARNSALNEDLGRASYVFSDKTGTLTQNDMRIRQLSLRGRVCGQPPDSFRMEDQPDLDSRALMAAWDPHLLAALQHVAGTAAWQQLLQQGYSKGLQDHSVEAPNHNKDDGDEEGCEERETYWKSGCDLLDMMLAILTCNTVILEPVPDSTDDPDTHEQGHQEEQQGQQEHLWPPDGLRLSGAGGHREPWSPGPSQSSQVVADQVQLPSDLLQEQQQQPKQTRPEPAVSYQGPSPDEVALLEGARGLGFELVARHKGGGTRQRGATGSGDDGNNGEGGERIDKGIDGTGGGAGSGHAVDLLQLSLWGVRVDVQLLNLLEFSSDRKRMSCVVQTPGGALIAYVKGADNVMLPLLRDDTPGQLLHQTHEDLSLFASQGLRTLAVGRRVLAPDWYSAWDTRYQEAAAAIDAREERVAQCSIELEQELELIGVTAIEDRLQDGVPEAVQSLLDCGIKVWMITGDKRETACNIAVSCALFPHTQNIMTVSGDNKTEASQCIQLLLQQQQQQQQACSGEAATPPSRNKATAAPGVNDHSADDRVHDQHPATLSREHDFHQGSGSHQHHNPAREAREAGLHLVVDGKALNHVLPDARLRRKLARLAARCDAVLVCRASPAQKAAIVKMMSVYLHQEQLQLKTSASPTHVPLRLRGLASLCTRALHWVTSPLARLRKQGPVLLAVGDGANDVPMLQAANVGVGLLGREGRQAANAADYTIPQFRCLVPLLLVHGSLCRHRLGRLVSFSFYKNVAFWMILFAFQPFCGWSGQAIVDDVTAAFYNVVFTSLPIFLFALLDRQVTDAQLLAHPELYRAGLPALSTWRFWSEGVLLGMAHGAVAFLVPYLSSGADGVAPSNSMSSVGKSVFVALLGAVTLEIAITTRFWAWHQVLITLLSFACVLPIMAIIPYAEQGIHYADLAYQGVVPVPLMHTAHFWLSVLAVCALVAGSRVVWVAGHWLLVPSRDMKLAQIKAHTEHTADPVQAQC